MSPCVGLHLPFAVAYWTVAASTRFTFHAWTRISTTLRKMLQAVREVRKLLVKCQLLCKWEKNTPFTRSLLVQNEMKITTKLLTSGQSLWQYNWSVEKSDLSHKNAHYSYKEAVTYDCYLCINRIIIRSSQCSSDNQFIVFISSPKLLFFFVSWRTSRRSC
jgi:hypothetical protein